MIKFSERHDFFRRFAQRGYSASDHRYIRFTVRSARQQRNRPQRQKRALLYERGPKRADVAWKTSHFNSETFEFVWEAARFSEISPTHKEH